MPPLTKTEADVLLKEVPGWMLSSDAKKISREFTFPDFKSALSFVDRVGEVAEVEGHHPDILLAYGRVRIKLWTHAVNGLSENDFITAAKVSELLHLSPEVR